MDYRLPGSPVHGMLQARILQWVAISSSRECSWPKDWTRNSCLLHWQVDSLPPSHLGSPRPLGGRNKTQYHATSPPPQWADDSLLKDSLLFFSYLSFACIGYRWSRQVFLKPFSSFNVYWSVVALRCCVSFHSPAKWISYMYKCIPFFWISFPLGHHRALSRVPWAIQ